MRRTARGRMGDPASWSGYRVVTRRACPGGAFVSSYNVVLFIHLTFVIVSFGGGFLLTAAGLRIGRATELRDLRGALLAAKRIGPLMPLGALGILGSGAYLADRAFSFGDPWVVGAICGLVVMEILGGAVAGRHAAALGKRVGPLGDGPVPAEIAEAQHDIVPAAADNVTMTLAFGIVFLMATKPAAAGTAATLLIAVAVGLAAAVALVRRPAGAPAAVPETAVTETA